MSEGRGLWGFGKKDGWKEGWKERRKEGFQPAAADVLQCLSPEARVAGDSQHNRLDGHQRTSQ